MFGAYKIAENYSKVTGELQDLQRQLTEVKCWNESLTIADTSAVSFSQETREALLTNRELSAEIGSLQQMLLDAYGAIQGLKHSGQVCVPEDHSKCHEIINDLQIKLGQRNTLIAACKIPVNFVESKCVDEVVCDKKNVENVKMTPILVKEQLDEERKIISCTKINQSLSSTEIATLTKEIMAQAADFKQTVYMYMDFIVSSVVDAALEKIKKDFNGHISSCVMENMALEKALNSFIVSNAVPESTLVLLLAFVWKKTPDFKPLTSENPDTFKISEMTEYALKEKVLDACISLKNGQASSFAENILEKVKKFLVNHFKLNDNIAQISIEIADIVISTPYRILINDIIIPGIISKIPNAYDYREDARNRFPDVIRVRKGLQETVSNVLIDIFTDLLTNKVNTLLKTTYEKYYIQKSAKELKEIVDYWLDKISRVNQRDSDYRYQESLSQDYINIIKKLLQQKYQTVDQAHHVVTNSKHHTTQKSQLKEGQKGEMKYFTESHPGPEDIIRHMQNSLSALRLVQPVAPMFPQSSQEKKTGQPDISHPVIDQKINRKNEELMFSGNPLSSSPSKREKERESWELMFSGNPLSSSPSKREKERESWELMFSGNPLSSSPSKREKERESWGQSFSNFLTGTQSLFSINKLLASSSANSEKPILSSVSRDSGTNSIQNHNLLSRREKTGNERISDLMNQRHKINQTDPDKSFLGMFKSDPISSVVKTVFSEPEPFKVPLPNLLVMNTLKKSKNEGMKLSNELYQGPTSSVGNGMFHLFNRSGNK
ncbi:uncharacterized protein LOC128636682 [Bombina bombina]|uniref:uncharacterized protein LOC128636682 n=1 Tax=Bombina bombina TaxID=8345 RepID=UPI00235A66FD|nr:uncharacterized protein LOC128636682 [Bombina bombina]